MTSSLNHQKTIEFFENNKYFGAPRDAFIFFEQAMIPAIDSEGKIILEDKHLVSMSPNGNGALFDAILRYPVL